MSSQLFFDPPPRKSKQQASKSITEQSRKRPLVDDDISEPVTNFPTSVYGEIDQPMDFLKPDSVLQREVIANGLLNTVSNMYFGTTEPFAEILRCLDDRIDRSSHRYVSGLETLLKNEVVDVPSSKAKVSKEKVIITPLDMLACTFREAEVIDQWSPYDVALFQLGICETKGFNAKKLGTVFEGRKSVEELTQFFEKVYRRSENWARLEKLLIRESVPSEDDASVKSEGNESLEEDS